MTDQPAADRSSETPPSLTGVVPYLMLDGVVAAIEFYKTALGAEEAGERALTPDGRVLNARIEINGGTLMLMDPMPEHGHAAAPHDSFNLHLQVDDADVWFDRAVAAGCEPTLPMSLMFWGDRYGQFKDPFGVRWGVAHTPR